jgi:hypothetical protein
VVSVSLEIHRIEYKKKFEKPNPDFFWTLETRRKTWVLSKTKVQAFHRHSHSFVLMDVVFLARLQTLTFAPSVTVTFVLKKSKLPLLRLLWKRR